MSTVMSRACVFVVAMAVALGGCGNDEPSGGTPPPGSTPPQGGAGEFAVNLEPLSDAALDQLMKELVTVTVRPPALPTDAVRQTIGAGGGEVKLGSVSAAVPANGASGELELALIPRQVDVGQWEPSADRIRPLGEPFSLAVNGVGVLNGGAVEIEYDGAAVPEGWEVRLARVPAELLLGSTALAQQSDGDARRRPDAQRPPTFSLSDLADIDDPGRLRDDLTELLGSRDDLLQVVLVRGVETIRVKDENGRHWLTVHMVEPPVHGKREFMRRLINALDNSRTKAEELEFRRPAGVISVTVLGEVRIEKAVPAAVWGNDIAICNSLHVYGPFDGAGLLERVAAEMYFRVLWANAVSAETLALRKPVSNRWVIDSSSEWFVRQVYPTIADETEPRRAVESLFTLGPEAHPFWQFLEKKTGTWSFAAHLMDIEYERRLRAAGLPRDKWRDLMKSKVFEAQAIGAEAVLLSQTMAMRIGWGAPLYDPGRREPQLMVKRAVIVFGYLYSMFAAEYLRQFLPQEPAAQAPTEDNPLGDRVAAEQGARKDYPLTAPWVQVSLTNVDESDPLEHQLVLDDFSAAIVRYIQPVQRGYQRVSIREVTFRDKPADRAPFAYAFASQKYPLMRVRGGGEGVGDIQDVGAPWPAGDSLALLVNPNMSWWQPDTTNPSGGTLVLDSALRSGPIGATLTAHMSRIDPPKTPDGRGRWPFDRPMGSGSGKKHCVGNIPGKQCFATIQQAIHAQEVEPGDIILVGPGEYNEAVEVKKADLTIVGTQPGAVVVRAESNIVFNIEAPGTRIGNLLILRQGGYGPGNADWAVAIRGQDVWLVNNVIAGAPGTGVHMSGVNHRIINNWLNVSNHGIYASDCPGVQIQNNVILPMLVRGGIAGWHLTNLGVEVPGEELDQGNVGITVYGGDGALVSGNYVGPDPEHPAPGWFGALYLTQAQWPRVFDNDLHTYGLQQSVFLRSIAHAQFRDNRVSGGGTAIDIAGDSPEDLTFEHNIVDAGGTAISIRGARGVYFHDNTLLSRTQALSLSGVTDVSASQDRFDGWSRRWFGSPWSGGIAVSLSECSDVRLHNVTAIGINSTVSIDKCKGVRLRNSTLHQLRYDGRVENPSVAAVLQDVDDAEINSLKVRSAFGGLTIIRGSAHTIRGLDLVDPRLEAGLYVDGVDVAARQVEFPDHSFVPVFGMNVTVGLDGVTFGESEQVQPAVVLDRLEYRGFPAGTDGSNELPRLTYRPAPLERPDRQGVTLYLPYEWKTGGVAILNFDLDRTRRWIRPAAGDRLNSWDRLFSVFTPPDEAAGGPIRIVLERAE